MGLFDSNLKNFTRLTKGDRPDHDFHGNQYTAAAGSPQKGDSVKFAKPNPDENPDQVYHQLDNPNQTAGRVDIMAANSDLPYPGVQRVDHADLVLHQQSEGNKFLGELKDKAKGDTTGYFSGERNVEHDHDVVGILTQKFSKPQVEKFLRSKSGRVLALEVEGQTSDAKVQQMAVNRCQQWYRTEFAVKKSVDIEKGDSPGHEFRGNQFTNRGGSRSSYLRSKTRADDASFKASRTKKAADHMDAVIAHRDARSRSSIVSTKAYHAKAEAYHLSQFRDAKKREGTLPTTIAKAIDAAATDLNNVVVGLERASAKCVFPTLTALRLAKGDVQGHEFHGNQWTGHAGSGDGSKEKPFVVKPSDIHIKDGPAADVLDKGVLELKYCTVDLPGGKKAEGFIQSDPGGNAPEYRTLELEDEKHIVVDTAKPAPVFSQKDGDGGLPQGLPIENPNATAEQALANEKDAEIEYPYEHEHEFAMSEPGEGTESVQAMVRYSYRPGYKASRWEPGADPEVEFRVFVHEKGHPHYELDVNKLFPDKNDRADFGFQLADEYEKE